MHDHSIAQRKCKFCAALHLFFTMFWKQVYVIRVKYVPCFYVKNKMTFSVISLFYLYCHNFSNYL